MPSLSRPEQPLRPEPASQQPAPPEPTPPQPTPPQPAAPEPAPPDAGALIGDRYRLSVRLGSGGMGTVWRARDEVMDRDVAVKEPRLPENLTPHQRETMYARMHREARAAARIDHPAVVDIFDVVLVDTRPWIVMELVRGESLESALTEGTLSPQEAARVGLLVLDALTAAHDKGVLHRDVKPANVMLGPFERVVLTDFGIAQIEGEAPLTETGVFIGSPGYIAPERVLGNKPGAASDLFSLGVLLYTALEGHSPFQRQTHAATMHAVVSAVPQPPVQSGELGPLILRLLSKEPGARPDPDQIASVLKSVAKADRAASWPPPTTPPHGEGSTGVPIPPSSPPGARPRRGARYAVVACATVLAAAFGGWLVPSPLDDDKAADPPPKGASDTKQEEKLPEDWKRHNEKSLGASVAVPDHYKAERESDGGTNSVWYEEPNGDYDIEVTRNRDADGHDSFAEAQTWVDVYAEDEDYYDTNISLNTTSLQGERATELIMTYRDKADSEEGRIWRMRELYYVNSKGVLWNLTMIVPTTNTVPIEKRDASTIAQDYGKSEKADDIFDNAVEHLRINDL